MDNSFTQKHNDEKQKDSHQNVGELNDTKNSCIDEGDMDASNYSSSSEEKINDMSTKHTKVKFLVQANEKESKCECKAEVKATQVKTILKKNRKYNNRSYNVIHKCPYECCGREFKEKGNLRNHLRSHTGDKPFICHYENCKSSFSTKGNLKAHYFIHTDRKRYSCNFPNCDLSYSHRNRLIIHMRTHSGDKPYCCPYPKCNTKFNEKGNLKTHMRKHNGSLPYVCTYDGCSAAFKFSESLRSHMKVHSMNTDHFVCHICSVPFTRYIALRSHLNTHIYASKTKLVEDIIEGRTKRAKKLTKKRIAEMRNRDEGTAIEVLDTKHDQYVVKYQVVREENKNNENQQNFVVKDEPLRLFKVSKNNSTVNTNIQSQQGSTQINDIILNKSVNIGFTDYSVKNEKSNANRKKNVLSESAKELTPFSLNNNLASSSIDNEEFSWNKLYNGNMNLLNSKRKDEARHSLCGENIGHNLVTASNQLQFDLNLKEHHDSTLYINRLLMLNRVKSIFDNIIKNNCSNEKAEKFHSTEYYFVSHFNELLRVLALMEHEKHHNIKTFNQIDNQMYCYPLNLLSNITQLTKVTYKINEFLDQSIIANKIFYDNCSKP